MTRRWTIQEDLFLVGYFESVGSWIGPHDLGRSERATKARVRALKEKGGWEWLKWMNNAEGQYYLAMDGSTEAPCVQDWSDAQKDAQE